MITHYRWVAQLCVSRHIQDRAQKVTSYQAIIQSAGIVRDGPSAVTAAARVFPRFVRARDRLPPQLHRPTRTRRKEPIAEGAVRFRGRPRNDAVAASGACRKARWQSEQMLIDLFCAPLSEIRQGNDRSYGSSYSFQCPTRRYAVAPWV